MPITDEELAALRDEVLETAARVKERFAKWDATVASLTKENDELRDQIAGNTRELPEGTSLEVQLEELQKALQQVNLLVIARRLRGVVVMWNEGRAIVVHAQAQPVPLIVTPS